MRKTTKRDLIIFLFCVILYGGVEALIAAGVLNPYWERTIVNICINIMLAASLNLINGITGQFSIGHAGFMAIGAYISAIMTVNFDMPFIVAIIAGAFVAGVLGFIIGLPTLRLKGDYLAIATLGLGEIIRITILNIPYVGGASGFRNIPHYTDLAWAFFTMIIMLFFIKNFVNSTHGRACISIRENEIAAEAMGVNTTKYKVLAFTIGAAFAGVAGALFSHYSYVAHPNTFTFIKSFDILTMVVLGGLGSMSGSILGAVLLTFVNAAFAEVPDWRMVAYAVILISLMIFRPQGILGNKELSLNMFKNLGGGRGGAVKDN